MAFRSIGGSRIIGQGRPQAVPITLDPSPYEGAVAYGSDGLVYVSNGTAWNAVGQGIQGTTGTQGDNGLQGLQGDYGPGFDVIGSVPDVDADADQQLTLNTAFPSATTGQGVIDNTDDELWVYDGTLWVNVGSFRGIQGFDGNQGTQGLQGVIGEEGIQGSRGVRGFQGIQGPQGTTGIQGIQGLQGRQGTQGVQGVQGPQGTQGIQGNQGLQGVQGPQAFQGVQGVQGDIGFQGMPGDSAGMIVQYNMGHQVGAPGDNPGNGFFRTDIPAGDTGSFGSVTKMQISDSDSFSIDLTAYFEVIDASTSANKAVMKITKRDNPSKYAIFTVQDLTDLGTYFDTDITFVAGTAVKEDFVVETSPGSGTFQSFPLIVAFSIAGDQGIQGVQGIQGPQGTQGFQGLQGDQGVQGIQGVQGLQGFQGFQGLQGNEGFAGGLTFNWVYSSDTTESFPGLNGWKINSGNVRNATELWIDDLTETGRRVDELFDFLDLSDSNPKGFIFVRTEKDNSNDEYEFVIYQFSDWTWDSGGSTKNYGYFDVTYVSSSNLGGTDANPGTSWTSGAVPTYGTSTVINFIPVGQRGIQGETGFQGATGVQGLLGLQGIQGLQGPQGTQGIQGLQGTQGLQGGGGAQGAQGFQGTQGFQGVQGAIGHYGGLTYEWMFTNDINPNTNPGVSAWKINNSNVTLATKLTIDDIPLDAYSGELDEMFDWLAAVPGPSKGTVIIESFDDGFGPGGHHQVVYEYSGINWDTSGTKTYVIFDVQYIGQYGLTSNSWQTDVIAAGHTSKTLINFVPRGEAGLQGTTGSQGFQGFTGAQGTQGFQGAQGFQGSQGFQGDFGPSGGYGGMTFDYIFNSDTSPLDPGAGRVKFNNGSVASASVMYLDDLDDGGTDLQGFFRDLKMGLNGTSVVGYVKIIDGFTGTNTDYSILEITTVTERGGDFQFGVNWLSGSQTSWTNGEPVKVSFEKRGVQGFQGPQGTEGFQGDLGFQGSTGAGTQGMQGPQGDYGFQGTQGFPGPIGPQGVQGTEGFQGSGGLQGITGGFGGMTFDYTYDTDTQVGSVQPPAVGYLKFDNSSMAAVTTLIIHDRDDNFTDIQPFLRTVDDSTSPIKGHFKVSEKDNPENFVIFTISGLTEQSGWFDIDANFVSGSASNFADNEDIIITFARTGDVGPIGSQGVQGIQAAQGIQGLQGGPGDEGTQGTLGFQGTQGFQGTAGFIGGTGIQGLQGLQGPQGTQGIKGEDGQGGFQGLQGLQGVQGLSNQGTQGAQGFQGFAGIGATGIQGFQGFQGVQQAGHQGIQGNDGPAGFGGQGTQGAQGPEGEEGDPGTQGVQGLIGIGEGGVQGLQGLDGDEGAQGFQGLGGEGNQGVQGFQGAVGIGGDGIQGLGGFQGTQGPTGDQGEGSQGFQGDFGPQGTQGVDGGFGNPGAQGFQGTQGSLGFQGPFGSGSQGIQGSQGFQGQPGLQGFPGQGTQGIQGIQAAQGLQGERGFQGIQGLQGPGIQGGVANLQNVHETGLQDTPIFVAMFEAGASERPLMGTTGPNPGGESNFYYTSDVDELTVENIQVEGNLTVVGTLTAAGVEGNTSAVYLPADVALKMAGIEADPYVELLYETASNAFVVRGEPANMNDIAFRDDLNADIFTFDMSTGDFTATGDITANSDESLKEKIVTIDTALEKVCDLRGVYFEMKSRPGVRKAGFIAQEIEKVLPEVVTTGKDGIKSVAYSNVTALIVEAIKELKDEVNDLKG